MAYVNARIKRLKRRLAAVQAALSALYETRLEMTSQNIDSYKFDSGEGSQSVSRRKVSEIAVEIERLEAEEDWIENELYGMGLINIGMRRIKPC